MITVITIYLAAKLPENERNAPSAVACLVGIILAVIEDIALIQFLGG